MSGNFSRSCCVEECRFFPRMACELSASTLVTLNHLQWGLVPRFTGRVFFYWIRGKGQTRLAWLKSRDHTPK